MKVGYFYKEGVEFAWTGAPLEQCNLKDKLDSLCKLPKDHDKHMVGSIWFHTNNKVGVEFNPVSDGIVGCDIDAIPKEDCRKIVDNFDTLTLAFPCLVSCWYSHSYYNSDKEYGGMHFVIKTDKDELVYDNEQYNSYRKNNIIYSAALARHIYNICGVDVRPKFNDKLKKTTGLDKAMLSIGQQCFLNYSEVVKWNYNMFKVVIDDVSIDNLEKWFIGYRWFENGDDFKVVSCKVKQFNTQQVISPDFKVNTDAFGVDKQLGHHRRVAVENFLAGQDWDEDSIVEFMMRICFGGDYRDGETALRKAVRQTTKTAITKFRGRPSAFYTERAKDILTAIGVDIEVEIEKIYQPIDYQYDSIFEEVWESMKDYKPTRQNYLHIDLKSNEFLTDYKHEITEMINKYEMTYLVADCMVGKTTFALNTQNEYGLFDDDFIVHFKGDTIDVCVPYNSVADNKAKNSRKDVKRVTTADLSKFSLEKRNVFIWNTVTPLYEKYFKSGVVKRLILFFDESQKIVTDDYRWETVFETFKVLPTMYKHFVFMTGTPAGELEYLKQYFNDYCVIKVDKEIDYNRECKILKYKQFGAGDRIKIIEDAISDNRLPLIYSNTHKSDWIECCRKINRDRVENGLKPLRILEYSRSNADRLSTVNKSNSIKEYDVVIATKYCSVGIDFQKDDKRMRTAIIDYAGEMDCTFHDIWQFTLRNRNQDTITKLIVHDDEMYNNKLYNYWYYVGLFEDMAKVHTYKMVKPNPKDETDSLNMHFAQDLFQLRQFGKLVSDRNNYFDDDKNVKLLAVYYLYVKIFGNINVIKHMLQRRDVTISEIEMEHIVEKINYTGKKEIYKFFVDNFNTISDINSNKSRYDDMSYMIDVNSNDTEYIEDNKIYSRNMHYMNWLIGQFAGKNEWLPILKEQEYITKETFAAYNRMALIANKTTVKEIDKIKRLYKHMNESDLDDLVVELVDKHYASVMNITKDDIRKAILLKDIVSDYKKILRFAIENIEFIEEIKNATTDGQRIAACHKMKIAMDQKEQVRIRKAQSDGAKKRNSKTITVQWVKNNMIETYESQDVLAEKLGIKKQNLMRSLKNPNSKIRKVLQLIDTE